ncbi:hypothetical protein LF41_2174 [Lysobacter dokdonensis DS-58]|uniref:Autotransporter domain-containing protein n=1 Tax=Lysobacter dokdonensis DS-58 TaxID=1300345 RepID=A0A0A2WMP9_9GAMM|nr:hypothetical protein [Lysobacter dokdonensis]KGQ20007.1 hypothetical protein LF41_2174 [Lysobacter dokdonensis DS-58]
MKNDRTRASRKAARRYNVSPVARAVRSVLTLSTAALLFSGTGAVLAKSPVLAPLPVERVGLSHEFAKVVDLTRVADEWTPKSVVDEEFQSLAAPIGASEATMFAAGAQPESLGVVDDPTILPGSFHPGPGGVSGGDDAVLVNIGTGGNWTMVDGYAPAPVVSNTGFADGAFFGTADSVTVRNYWDGLSVTGYTWAAGIEVESGDEGLIGSYDAITATATGVDGVAFGLYVYGANKAGAANSSAINAYGDGALADAFGMYAFSPYGDAYTINVGSIHVAADDTAVGGSSVALAGYAANENRAGATIDVTGFDATGLYAASLYGTAVNLNAGTITVAGVDATGLESYSVYGNAFAQNDGTLKVDGDFAQGAWAHSAYGSATTTNGATGSVNANGYYGAAGLIAGAYNGTATITNAGNASASSAAGIARGAFAYGDVAIVDNSGALSADGFTQAIGIDAEGNRSVDVVNSGSVVATSNGDAFGVWATSYGDTTVVNTASGSIDVDAINGIAYGIYAGGYDAYVRNWATVDVSSTYGDAIGIGVAGVYAFAENDSLVNATGGTAGVGMLGYGVVTSDLVNGGTINATATGTGAFAAGVLSIGDGASALNTGTITATGAFATGIDVRGTTSGEAINDNTVHAYGGDVTGISVSAMGQGGNANVVNYGNVTAEGDLFAVGAAAIARGYLGNASIYNGGNVYAGAKYGAAQGLVASADIAASIDNQGQLITVGGDSAYGMLALTADGDINVTNGGQMATVAMNRGYGIAYGIATQSNNGLISITNDGLMVTVGEGTAMGVYAATKWNDVEIENNGQMQAVAKYGAATGAIAITYTGDANVSNSEYGQVLVQGAYAASGLRAISLYGDANVTNDGDIETMGGVLDRGITSRAFYGGTATITNNGTITTDGGYSSYGVWARSGAGDAVVHNNGAIVSTSDYGVAYGALAGGAYAISIENTGDIRAYAGDTAAGVLAYSLGGDATVTNTDTGYLLGVSNNAAYGAQVIGAVSATLTNDGTIVASGYNLADAVFASGATVYVSNTGSLSADADGWAAGVEATGGDIELVSHTGADITAYAYSGRATGMFASADNDATVRNGGDLDASSYSGDAYGLFAQADGNAILTNGGALTATSVQGNAFGMAGVGYNADLSQSATITVSGNGTAVGIEGVGYAHANIVNNGDVDVTAASGIAAGLYTYSVHDTRQVNNGTIDVHATSGRAFGMYAYGFDDVEVLNFAGRSIDSSVDNGTAYGMFGYGARTILTNDGSVTATANSGQAIGLLGIGYETSNVTNTATGSIVASGTSAFGLIASGDVTTATNAGAITVHGGDVGVALQGVGMYDGSTVSIDNTGTLYANVNNKYGTSAGIVGSAGGDVDITNGGSVEAHNGRVATGVVGYSEYGNVTIGNTGDIAAYGGFFNGRGVGIDATTYDGDIAIDSDGSILATGKYASGINAIADGGDVTVVNGGAITAATLGRQGLGILATSYDGAVSVTNSGTIDVGVGSPVTGAMVMGVVAGSEYGDASIHNLAGATVTANNEYGMAGGLYGYGAHLTIDNGGDVLVTGGPAAVGVAFDALDATIVNTGSITVSQLGGSNTPPPLAVEEGNGIGIAGFVAEGGLAHVTNDGAISVTAHDVALGIQVMGDGDILIDGTGTISVVSSYAEAIGIEARGPNVDVTNGGTTQVTGYAFAAGIEGSGDVVNAGNTGHMMVNVTGMEQDAVGIAVLASTTADIDNQGDLTVTAASGDAYGASAYSDTGVASIGNGGSIAVTANYDAVAIFALGATANVDNTGDITATAGSHAIGLFANGDTVDAFNGGHATATATGADGMAYGARVSGEDVTFGNDGTLSAFAEGDGGIAIGALAAGGTLHADNGGHITATSEGAGGLAIGFGAYAGGDLFASNGGEIYAIAYNGAAIGAIAGSYDGGNVTFGNSGTIAAHAAGETIGLRVGGDADATVTNSGTIGAIHADYAVALSLDVFGNATVNNTGDIVAQASEEGSIAIHGGDGFDLVTNSGDIVGALVTGAGNDRLTNAAGGTWTVRGHATDFGDGDDAIVNAGTIVLHDAGIGLGGNSATGNSFANTGTLSILGDSTIDMGTGSSVVTLTANPAAAPIAVLNPVAFTNNGTISFLDGAPDDTLTIHGDFAGQGALNVDVSLLNGASDMLYVDGNFANNAVQSLNINVLDMLTGATEIDIPVVVVTGESQANNVRAGSIIAGNVNFNANNFLDLKVAVNPHITAANGAVDMFSLTLGFGGLNDTGALATAIVPGAHSLMAAQVGTFRQRMGVFSQLGDSDKGAWVRVFGDKGTINPEAQLDNLPASSNFAFDQTNQGVEAGYNALITDGFYIGASLSKSRGKQDLANGFGDDDIDGTTLGGYLTWLGQNGMYADVSYRWMHFDADMTSLGGVREVGGDAGAFNAELGWNIWTSAGGLKLVPQVQYTRTTVENVDRIEGDLADFVSDGGTSSRARLGLEMEQTFDSASGTKWTPYGVLSIVREFDGETSFTVADTFTGRTTTEGTSGQVEFGVNAKIGQRVDVWGGLNYMDGGAIDGVWGGQVGIRYTW